MNTRGGAAAEAPRTWKWGERPDRYEAILGDADITWILDRPHDMGGASDQPILEFLAFGPDETDVPAEVLAALRDAIEARDPAGWARVLAAVGALREARAQESVEKERNRIAAEQAYLKRSRAARALPDPWRTYDKSPPSEARPEKPSGTPPGTHRAASRGGPAARPAPSPPQPVTPALATPASVERPDPLGPLLVHGFLLFAVSTVVPLLLANVLPLLANYVGLFLPVLLGFFTMYRWKSVALVITGFFAMAGVIGSQVTYDRYMELARGTVVTLDSVVEMPRHPEATRFIVGDVRAVQALAASASRTTSTGGAGPRVHHYLYHVMPLVPRGWQRSEPVPAWIGCSAERRDGSDCLKKSGREAYRSVRVGDYDLGFYEAAVLEAEKEHGLASAEGAPIVEISSDPAAAPAKYFAASLLVPLAVYGLWAILLTGWRVWRRMKAKPATSR